MSLLGWGRYPNVENKVIKFRNKNQIQSLIRSGHPVIAHGNGRSYGDSALSNTIVHTRPQDYFINFDEESGLLHLEAGALLSEVLDHFVPRGWFLKVTPGTKFITVGGAIASDVHGKNHHVAGCFSECIQSFDIMLADGSTVICSRELMPELFKATCGGMGLTGIILSAKIFLKSINSQFIDQTTIKTRNLKETFDAFEKHKDVPYSVAWIDCLAKDDKLGRCLLTTGEFRNDGKLDYKNISKPSIPFNFPSIVLNNWNVRTFNWLYYGKVKEKHSKQKVTFDTFFYPLDAIGHWNRIYGKKGFVQYQFILPKASSFEGLQEALNVISKSGKGSFLAVLKLYGKANDNWLSFPMEGYSLALDFKMGKGVLELLDKLDEIVVKYRGRVYLTKDARISKESFEQGYPQVNLFRKFRNDNHMSEVFQSLQSKRLGI